MKRQFTATVVGISPTTTSANCGGAHAVTMTLDGQGSCAPMPTNVELPLFNADEARALGSLYRVHHAVLVTFETPDVTEEKAGNGRPCEGDRGDLALSWSPDGARPATGFVQVGIVNGDESGPPCLYPYDPPRPRHGILGIGVTPRDAPAPAPPMVNGRPSCCDRASGASGGIWTLFRHPEVQGWCINSRSPVTVRFCPFCGAKLPEVT